MIGSVQFYLYVFVSAADVRLDGAERLGVAHLAKLVRHAGRDTAKHRRRRLLGSHIVKYSVLR